MRLTTCCDRILVLGSVAVILAIVSQSPGQSRVPPGNAAPVLVIPIGDLTLEELAAAQGNAKSSLPEEEDQNANAGEQLDFERFLARIQRYESHLNQEEELRIEANGECWYRVHPRAEVSTNVPARPGAVIRHHLTLEQRQKLNDLLRQTQWLTHNGAVGRAGHTHPDRVTLAIKRNAGQQSVFCEGQQPEPYAALLRMVNGLATQERRMYLIHSLKGREGETTWTQIGNEIAALHGSQSYSPPRFELNYKRYLPHALELIHSDTSRPDDELIPAVRLIGHLKLASELAVVHEMFRLPTSQLGEATAWAMERIHDPQSLPVLANMMSHPFSRDTAGLVLVNWGEEATPHIVSLIGTSMDKSENVRVVGEFMIRAYLDHWQKLKKPVPPTVIDAVRAALAAKDPSDGMVRTEYHSEFLKRVESVKRPGE